MAWSPKKLANGKCKGRMWHWNDHEGSMNRM